MGKKTVNIIPTKKNRSQLDDFSEDYHPETYQSLRCGKGKGRECTAAAFGRANEDGEAHGAILGKCIIHRR